MLMTVQLESLKLGQKFFCNRGCAIRYPVKRGVAFVVEFGHWTGFLGNYDCISQFGDDRPKSYRDGLNFLVERQGSALGIIEHMAFFQQFTSEIHELNYGPSDRES